MSEKPGSQIKDAIDSIQVASHSSGPRVVEDIFDGFKRLSQLVHELGEQKAESRRKRRNARARLRRSLSKPKTKTEPIVERTYEPPSRCYCAVTMPPCGWCTRECEEEEE
jgi:hypothetical protein